MVLHAPGKCSLFKRLKTQEIIFYIDCWKWLLAPVSVIVLEKVHRAVSTMVGQGRTVVEAGTTMASRLILKQLNLMMLKERCCDLESPSWSSKGLIASSFALETGSLSGFLRLPSTNGTPSPSGELKEAGLGL